MGGHGLEGQAPRGGGKVCGRALRGSVRRVSRDSAPPGPAGGYCGNVLLGTSALQRHKEQGGSRQEVRLGVGGGQVAEGYSAGGDREPWEDPEQGKGTLRPSRGAQGATSRMGVTPVLQRVDSFTSAKPGAASAAAPSPLQASPPPQHRPAGAAGAVRGGWGQAQGRHDAGAGSGRTEAAPGRGEARGQLLAHNWEGPGWPSGRLVSLSTSPGSPPGCPGPGPAL